MFLCFENAVLVRGNNKALELKYGKDRAGHGWIEIDNYCYDPSLSLKFKKEIYKPYNVSKTTIDEYKKINKQLYEDIVNAKLIDFQPNGKKRTDLCTMIPVIQEISEMIKDTDFKKELNEYLKLINYDEKQICEDMNIAIQKCLNKEVKKSNKI